MFNLAEYAHDLFDISLSETQMAQFERYLHLLVEWNQRMNLTTIVEPDAIRIRHFLDSLSLVEVATLEDEMRVIDIGTGAGLPGLALHIAFPFLRTTLLDSTGKKITFLNYVIEDLQLKNIDAIHFRAEDAAQLPGYREKFDLVTARAVARLPVLAEYLLPFARLGGICVAMKGVTASQEIEDAIDAIDVLGGGVLDNHEIQLPDVNDPHYLISIKKMSKTPKMYPRKAGVPSRNPLE